MKNIILFIFVTTLISSCKKEKNYNIDENIKYCHWYKTGSNISDTLFNVYIPNSFTPNQDGINDAFYPKGYFYLMDFKIMERNNNTIFETTDRIKYWDGKYFYDDYKTYQQGVYTYTITISDTLGEHYEHTGNVFLYK